MAHFSQPPAPQSDTSLPRCGAVNEDARDTRVTGAVSHTAGPWTLELVQSFPYGVRVVAGDRVIMSQDAVCFATQQKTRADNERGIGFGWGPGIATPPEAAAAIAEQDANARLIAAAPGLLTAARAWLALDERGLLPMTTGVRAAVAVTRAAVGRVMGASDCAATLERGV